MKKYTDYIDEISADRIYEGLLGYGLFDAKLPPIFTSESFYSYCQKNTPNFSNKEHDYISWDSIRNINIPRALSIPNPMAYQRLCTVIKDNWIKIQEHFHRQTDSDDYIISRIHIRERQNAKSLFKMSYDNWREDGTPSDDLIFDKRYVVYADISTCFPSIYTHSICWALVGKEKAKEDRRKGWFNDIDKACQNLCDGQTHGIMIGPHASNLISEIILTSIDNKLSANEWKFIRNIDDYTCYVKNREEADSFLRELNMCLKEYDLPLNHKKTKIQKLPIAFAEQWVRRLNGFALVTSYGKVDYRAAKAYFDLAVELMAANEMNAATLNYAIKVLSKQKLTENAKTYCIKESMHLSLLFPYLIPLMEHYVFEPYGVGLDLVKKFSDKLYEVSSAADNYEGMCYAIYYSLKYNFDLSCVDTKEILKTNSCILKLFGMLYYRKRKNKAMYKEYRDHAKELKKTDMDRNWLFVYETLTEGNLSEDWKVIKKGNVSFILPEFEYID